jgi:hypothetical protein
MKPHHFNPTLVTILLVAVTLNAQSASDHLQRALRLADLNNWTAAEEDFSEAERMFTGDGDRRNALYARLGKIRATVRDRSLASTSAQLASELEDNPLLQNDKELRMFCLAIKGENRR